MKRTTWLQAPQVSSSRPRRAASCWTAAAVAGSGLPSASRNSLPIISPRPRTSVICSCLSATVCSACFELGAALGRVLDQVSRPG